MEFRRFLGGRNTAGSKQIVILQESDCLARSDDVWCVQSPQGRDISDLHDLQCDLMGTVQRVGKFAYCHNTFAYLSRSGS